MRTLSKDILMVCKGWYNSDKSRPNALKSYIAEYIGCDEVVKDDTVLHFLRHTVNKFVDKNVLLYTLSNGAESLEYRKYTPMEFLIDQYIGLIVNQSITHIDMSDYYEIRKYVLGNDYKDGEKFWWSKDKFGTTDVYDDRQD